MAHQIHANIPRRFYGRQLWQNFVLIMFYLIGLPGRGRFGDDQGLGQRHFRTKSGPLGRGK